MLWVGKYKVGGFILATIKILRVSHRRVWPDPVSVLCFDIFTLILLARPFLQFAQTVTVWDSKPDTSLKKKKGLHDISVNRVNF